MNAPNYALRVIESQRRTMRAMAARIRALEEQVAAAGKDERNRELEAEVECLSRGLADMNAGAVEVEKMNARFTEFAKQVATELGQMRHVDGKPELMSMRVDVRRDLLRCAWALLNGRTETL